MKNLIEGTQKQKKDAMKKLFAYIFCCFSLGLSAQSLEVREAPDFVQFDAQTSFYETGLTIYNGSDSAIAVVAERVDNRVTDPQYDYFCWDVCYGATVNRSIGAIQIRPDKATDAFTLTFLPEGESSPAEITMRFFNRANLSDFVEHTFHFTTSATPIEASIPASDLLSQPYPHPARSFVHFDYELPHASQAARLELYNLIGKQLYTTSLTERAGTATLSVDNYPPGIYMISMVVDDERVASRRVIVTH